MIELTEQANQEIGQGECRWSYLQEHEKLFPEDLSMQNDEQGNLVSPEFSGKLFLQEISLTKPDSRENVFFTLARMIILDYLKKNGIDREDPTIEKFPRSGRLKFQVPHNKKGNFVSTYVPSLEDKAYVAQNKKSRELKIDVAQLANAYASEGRKGLAEEPKPHEGPKLGF